MISSYKHTELVCYMKGENVMNAIFGKMLRSNFRCGRMLNSRMIGMCACFGVSAGHSF